MRTAFMRAVAAAAMVAASISAAAEPLNPSECSEADLRAVIAEALAPTNATTGSVYAHLATSGVFSAKAQSRFPSVFAELDATMAERGFLPHWWWQHPVSWPKVSGCLAKATGADVAYAASYAMCARLGCGLNPASVAIHGGTLDDYATLLSEAVAFPEKCSLPSAQIAKFRSSIQKAALPAVRRHIRQSGRSFVSKNGVNPCEEYMTGLTAALNAPRFAGLDAWFKSIGLKGVDLSRMPSEEEVAKLKDAVFYGDQLMNDRTKAILDVCLGVEGYNKFVREYNGN